MTRLSLIERDGVCASFEINKSNLSDGAIEKIKWAIMKKASEDADGGPVFGTGVFSDNDMMTVYLRKPVKNDNPNKTHREAVEVVEKLLKQALNYIAQENNVCGNSICEEARSVLSVCLQDLKNLK